MTAFLTRSQFGGPPTTETITLPDHRILRTVEENAEVKQRVESLASLKQEFVELIIDDGSVVDLKIDTALMYPPGFNSDNGKKYLGIVFVYGEPWGTTVKDRWDSRD